MNAARPFVLLNMAMTADGKIATANRAVTTFGSPRDLRHLYELRATADAVMAGARTIEETKAKLGPGGARYQRLRLRAASPNSTFASSPAAPRPSILAPRSSATGSPPSSFSPPNALRPANSADCEHSPTKSSLGASERSTSTRHYAIYAKVERSGAWSAKAAANSTMPCSAPAWSMNFTHLCLKIFGGARAPTVADGSVLRGLRTRRS